MKKKSKEIKLVHWLDAGIFPPIIMFVHGFSYDETITILKRKKADDWLMGISDDKQLIEDANYIALDRTLTNTKTGHKKYLYYIFIKEQFRFTDYEYCKLAHEVLHICQYCLPDILRRDREHEAEAYLHTHLMKQCLNSIRGK